MPIYEYRCEKCGHQLEIIQKMSDAPLADCPECGKAALIKLISAAGFQLKGTGWYQTDFKNSGKKPEAKTETKTETKTDSKAEPKAKAEGGGTCGSGGCGACS